MRSRTTKGRGALRGCCQSAASPQAMTRLGMMYHGAIGVERDPVIAAMWWRRAAERGTPTARQCSAQHFISGPASQCDPWRCLRLVDQG